MYKFALVILVFAAIANAELTGDWCGTIQALKDFHDGKFPTRPTLSGTEEFIDRTNFRVHYTRSGRDHVSLVYAESCASYLEYSWAKQVDSLGWAAPPPDGTLGGDSRYDYYITALSSGIAGVTYSESSYPNPYPNGASSHIRISNTLDLIGLAVVVCHEFNHACQFRYSSAEQSWWYENTATWMEDVCYPLSNDYVHYLTSTPNPLSNPELPITTFSGLYQYAGAIWGKFLEDCYDIDAPRKIWTYQGTISGQNTLSGTDYVLSTYYGSSLRTALKKYGLWRYFTGSRADTSNYFKESHLWTLARLLRTHDAYPTSGNQSPNAPSGPGGTNYIQFQNGGGKFFASFDGQDGYQWTCYIVGFNTNSTSMVYEMPLNAQLFASDSFFWQNADHFVLIPIVTQWESNSSNLTYNYTADVRVVHDIGVKSVSGIPAYEDSSVVLYPQAMVKNFGMFPETFSIRLTIGSFFSNTQNLFLNQGDSILISFAPCTLTVRDYSSFQCTTMLTTDERRSNDSKSDRIFVWVKDVACTAILEPLGNINQGTYIYPKARIKNYGNVHEIFDIDFLIGDWHTTKRLGLAAGLEFDMVFDSTWYANDTGLYTVKCSTKLDGDLVSNNNYLSASCRVLPNAVSEVNNPLIKSPWIIFNNGNVKISGVENLKSIEIEIFDSQGRMIYCDKPNRHSFDIEKKLPSGCYIVRLKSGNQTIITKSVIIK